MEDNNLRRRPSSHSFSQDSTHSQPSSSTKASPSTSSSPTSITVSGDGKFSRSEIEQMIHQYSAHAPKFAPYINKSAPFIAMFAQTFFTIFPYINASYHWMMNTWEKLEPYHLEEMAQAFFGFICCFFGGSFMTLIVAVEALRLGGWERTRSSIADLYTDYQKVKAANLQLTAANQSANDETDSTQIDTKALVAQKVRLFLVTCDPNKVSNALAGLSAGMVTVVATLKIRFAKSITLGSSVANVIRQPSQKFLSPILEKVIPQEYHRWIDPCINYACKIFGVSVAWFITRIISAFHSAFRGGVLMARGIIHYLEHIGHIDKIDPKETYLDEVVGITLGFIGLYWQLSYGFGLPFPLNIILFPLTLLEWMITWIVNAAS